MFKVLVGLAIAAMLVISAVLVILPYFDFRLPEYASNTVPYVSMVANIILILVTTAGCILIYKQVKIAEPEPKVIIKPISDKHQPQLLKLEAKNIGNIGVGTCRNCHEAWEEHTLTCKRCGNLIEDWCGPDYSKCDNCNKADPEL